jgi:uncharacterized protein (DUF2267 family)
VLRRVVLDVLRNRLPLTEAEQLQARDDLEHRLAVELPVTRPRRLLPAPRRVSPDRKLLEERLVRRAAVRSRRGRY